MTKEIKEIKDLKNLNVAELKKQDKKLNETRPFKIKIGDTEYKLTHDVIFRRTKQQKLLEDMLEFFNAVNGENIGMLDLASPYTALLIIKHFTSLDVSDNVDEALALLQVLTDLGVLSQIVNELPEEEVLKIYDLLTQTVKNIKENIEEAEQELEVIAPEIQNEEVLNFVGLDKEEVVEDGNE